MHPIVAPHEVARAQQRLREQIREELEQLPTRDGKAGLLPRAMAQARARLPGHQDRQLQFDVVKLMLQTFQTPGRPRAEARGRVSRHDPGHARPEQGLGQRDSPEHYWVREDRKEISRSVEEGVCRASSMTSTSVSSDASSRLFF